MPDDSANTTLLTVEVQRDASAVRLVLAGELDLATARQLQDAVNAALVDDARALVVDLGGLSFMDSSGLRALLWSLESAKAATCRFQLVRGPAHVDRVFSLVGLRDYFDFAE